MKATLSVQTGPLKDARFQKAAAQKAASQNAVIQNAAWWRTFALCALLCLPLACEKSESAPPANSNGERPTGTTPTTNDLFLDAVGRGELAEVRAYLNERGASIQARDGLGNSALLLAARKTDHLELVKFLYAADPQALDAGDNRDRTPLSWAAHFDRAPIIAYLLQAGAQIEKKDLGGNTALMVLED